MTGRGQHRLSRTAVATAAALGGFGVLSGVSGGHATHPVTTMSAAAPGGSGGNNALLEQVRGWVGGWRWVMERSIDRSIDERRGRLLSHQPHHTPCIIISWQEGLPRFQRIAPDAVVPGIRQLSSQFTDRFLQLEGAWKEQQAATWEGVVEAMENARHPLEYAWGVREEEGISLACAARVCVCVCVCVCVRMSHRLIHSPTHPPTNKPSHTNTNRW